MTKKSVPPLSINKLTKKYGQDIGVQNLSLELKEGEIFGFLGPNGAGKTTTIRTILNFMSPTEGDISLFGLDSVADSVEIKRNIGYLPGEISLYPKTTGRKLLRFLDSFNQNADWDYVEDLSQRLNLNLDKQIKNLSRGNKQKIGIAQALMHKPKLLIMDEPTNGLDPLLQQTLYDILMELKKDGVTIFVSSHNLSEVQKLCDRAAFIRSGKLIGTEPIKKTLSLSKRVFTVLFNSKPKTDFSKIKGVTNVDITDKVLTATVTGSVSPFLKELAKHDISDLDKEELSLDEVFLHYYKGEKHA